MPACKQCGGNRSATQPANHYFSSRILSPDLGSEYCQIVNKTTLLYPTPELPGRTRRKLSITIPDTMRVEPVTDKPLFRQCTCISDKDTPWTSRAFQPRRKENNHRFFAADTLRAFVQR